MVSGLIVGGMLVLGLIILIKGANYLVDGAADLATFFRVSPILVGLTIVAFGTSLPEFIVSFLSALAGKADISIGNIVGSNIANIGLIIGFAAIVTTLNVKSKTLIYEIPFLIISSFLLLILANNNFLWQQASFSIDRIDGIILGLIFVFFMFYIFRSMRQERISAKQEFGKEFKHKNPPWKNALFILGGITAVILGGKLFIDNASELARLFGLSEAFIGLAIAALGTSLPELATSAVAAWKNEGDIAIGNIVGSNIFNILFVLGLTSLIKPFAVTSGIIALDGIVMIFITLLFLIFMTTKQKIERWEGIVLLSVYLAYLTFLLWHL